jgi:hypothetical protein
MTDTMVLDTPFIRKRAEGLLRQCPDGWRVTFDEPKRRNEAAERFWAALRQFASEAEGVLPVRVSTKKLTVTEMSDLIELVYSVGSRRGIVFREPRLEPDWQPRRGAKKPLITQSKMLQIESKTNAV